MSTKNFAISALIVLFVGIGWVVCEEIATLQKAVELSNSGKYTEAVTELQKVITNDPNNADAYLSLGVVYTQLGNIDNAEQVLVKAISIKPDLLAAHYTLALIYEKKQMWPQAKSEWDKLLNCKDKNLAEIARKHVYQIEGKQ